MDLPGQAQAYSPTPTPTADRGTPTPSTSSLNDSERKTKHSDGDSSSYYSPQELVAAVPSQHNWKGIGISLFVILSVIGLVALAVVLVTPDNEGSRIPGERVKLADLVGDKFKPHSFNGTWVSGM